MDERKNIQPKYADHAPEHPVTHPIVETFALLHLSNRSARKLLENRTSLSSIKLWRTGRRSVPQWAAEILDRALAQSAEARHNARQRLRTVIGQGPDGTQGLLAWRLRRLAQKEKARD